MKSARRSQGGRLFGGDNREPVVASSLLDSLEPGAQQTSLTWNFLAVQIGWGGHSGTLVEVVSINSSMPDTDAGNIFDRIEGLGDRAPPSGPDPMFEAVYSKL
jgi:hypothetical protein